MAPPTYQGVPFGLWKLNHAQQILGATDTQIKAVREIIKSTPTSDSNRRTPAGIIAESQAIANVFQQYPAMLDRPGITRDTSEYAIKFLMKSTPVGSGYLAQQTPVPSAPSYYGSASSNLQYGASTSQSGAPASKDFTLTSPANDSLLRAASHSRGRGPHKRETGVYERQEQEPDYEGEELGQTEVLAILLCDQGVQTAYASIYNIPFEKSLVRAVTKIFGKRADPSDYTLSSKKADPSEYTLSWRHPSEGWLECRDSSN